MKKHRKQIVKVGGKKLYVDVPVDGELYTADNHEEYQRTRSKAKHASLSEVCLVDLSADVMKAYEETQLLEHLHKAMQKLTEKERLLIECIFYDGLTEQETAAILDIAQQTVNKKKHKIIKKLRNSLVDWF